GWVEGQLPEALADVRPVVRRLEHELFVAQAELARSPHLPPPEHRIEARHVTTLEGEIDRFSDAVGPLKSFVLERGSPPASALHIARTVARRAERELWALHRLEPIRPEILHWVNRLSDLLFALALYANHRLGIPEEPPDYSQ
ncbi:ATP/cobalamin adenosyltransferase, partial [mine drainage metagenome]